MFEGAGAQGRGAWLGGCWDLSSLSRGYRVLQFDFQEVRKLRWDSSLDCSATASKNPGMYS